MINKGKMTVLLIYREMIPSIRLCGHSQMEALSEMNVLRYRAIQEAELTEEDIQWANVVIIGRLDKPEEYLLVEQLKEAGKYIIYILDDDLLNLPKEVSSYQYYNRPKVRQAISGMLRLSDAIMSPSPLLLERYAGDGCRGILVEEPALNPSPYREREPSGPIRIGFAGSIDRTENLETMLEDALFRVKERYGAKVQFYFLGAIPAFAEELGAISLPYCDDYMEYRRVLDSLSWDIGLAPMPETASHACKHYNKFCEYAASCISAIYSDVMPYTRIPGRHRFGRFCKNTTEDWFDQICAEIEDSAGREAHRKNCGEYAEEKLNTEVVARALEPEMEAVRVILNAQAAQASRQSDHDAGDGGLETVPLKNEPKKVALPVRLKNKLAAAGNRRSFLVAVADFCERNRSLLLMTWVVMLAVWGTWLFHDIVTFDAEGLYSSIGMQEWYNQWFELGRPALVLCKRLLGALLINPYMSNAVWLVCFPLSALIWCVFFERCIGQDIGYYKILFVCVYVSHPVWSLLFSYRMHMDALAIAMVILPFGMIELLSWMKTGFKYQMALAFAAVVFCFSAFQSFMISFAEACAIILFLKAGESRDQKTGKALGKLLAFSVAAFLTWLAIARVYGYNPKTEYVAGQFSWKDGSIIDGLENIRAYIGKTMFGNGAEYNGTYGAISIVFLVRCIAQCIQRKRNAVKSLLFGACVWGFPYLLELVTAGNIVSRAQFAYVLAYAFLLVMDAKWLCGLFKWNANLRQCLALGITLLVFVPEIQLTTRLLYTDVQTMQRDKQIFQSIYDRAMEQGAQPGDVLYIHGGATQFQDETFLNSEVVGFSYFEFTGMNNTNTHKAIQAMRAYGLNVNAPNADQVALGAQLANELTAWPDKDSLITLPEDHLIVVKMG